MISLVNLNFDFSKYSNYLSNELLNKIGELKNSEKAILYFPKRGEYSALYCSDCHFVEKCKKCDIPYFINKNPLKLVCNICSEKKDFPIICKNCKGNNLKKLGSGTQQIEEIFIKLFPEKNILRIDADSLKTKTERKSFYESSKNAEIIIGNKSVLNFLDDENVKLIGIILTEQELFYSHFLAYEKFVQTIKNIVIGNEEKEIIFQTFMPENEIVKNAIFENYNFNLKKIISERKIGNFPPFSEMAILEFRHTSKESGKTFIEKILGKLNYLNEKNEFEIFLSENIRKKNSRYFFEIFVKGKNVKDFLENIRFEIVKNGSFTVEFY